MSHGEKHCCHHGQHPLPERGWVQFLLLLMINEQPMHAYQLSDVLEERGLVRKDRFKTGSLYTILNRMEEKELLTSNTEESDEGRPRRVYQITELGKTHLKQGLEHMLRRKRLLDELEEYYKQYFPVTQGDGENKDA